MEEEIREKRRGEEADWWVRAKGKIGKKGSVL